MLAEELVVVPETKASETNPYIDNLISSIKTAIKKENDRDFLKSYYQFKILFNKSIIEGSYNQLEDLHVKTSKLLAWFFRHRSSVWQGVERYMGGVEALFDLCGQVKAKWSTEEAVHRLSGSTVDQNIIKVIFQDGSENGILSGKISEKLNIKKNQTSNRLSELEKRGLIRRCKSGKNSIVFPTFSGKAVAEKLLFKEKLKVHFLKNDKKPDSKDAKENLEKLELEIQQYPKPIHRTTLERVAAKNMIAIFSDPKLEEACIKLCVSEGSDKCGFIIDSESNKIVEYNTPSHR